MGTAECTVDASGYVTHWSDEAWRLLGYTAAEVVGRSAARLLAEPVFPADVLSALSGHPERWSARLALRHRDGHRVEVVVIAHRRAPESGADTWRVVCPMDGGEPRREDDDLARWAFEQLPRCSVSI